ncbi:endonuclease domain-containing protein [Streptomyces sp. cg40]|uniref:endonuclease domain-containing protein n=1 Tax=Streptomyces sp. cg40 TaxID=3419764 RepID=UPI003CFEC795
MKCCVRCGGTKPHAAFASERTNRVRFGEGRPRSERYSERCRNASAVHVDHCHETGRVRCVLCFNCNSAIGKLGDDPDAVRRAAAYLEGSSWKPTLVAPGVYQLPS